MHLIDRMDRGLMVHHRTRRQDHGMRRALEVTIEVVEEERQQPGGVIEGAPVMEGTEGVIILMLETPRDSNQ